MRAMCHNNLDLSTRGGKGYEICINMVEAGYVHDVA
jgi:hypothetical protein